MCVKAVNYFFDPLGPFFWKHKLTEVVARGHCFSDADGGGSDRDDEHLVVAWDENETRLISHTHIIYRVLQSRTKDIGAVWNLGERESSSGVRKWADWKHLVGVNVQRTGRQVADREAVLDLGAGLSVAPALQAGVLLLKRPQRVVTAETLRREKVSSVSMLGRIAAFFKENNPPAPSRFSDDNTHTWWVFLWNGGWLKNINTKIYVAHRKRKLYSIKPQKSKRPVTGAAALKGHRNLMMMQIRNVLNRLQNNQ